MQLTELEPVARPPRYLSPRSPRVLLSSARHSYLSGCFYTASVAARALLGSIGGDRHSGQTVVRLRCSSRVHSYRAAFALEVLSRFEPKDGTPMRPWVFRISALLLLGALVASYFISSPGGDASDTSGPPPTSLAGLYNQYSLTFGFPGQVEEGNTLADWSLSFRGPRDGNPAVASFISTPPSAEGPPTEGWPCYFLVPADSMPYEYPNQPFSYTYTVKKYPRSSIWVYDRPCRNLGSGSFELVEDYFTVPNKVLKKIGFGQQRLDFQIATNSALVTLPDEAELTDGLVWSWKGGVFSYSIDFPGAIVDAKVPGKDTISQSRQSYFEAEGNRDFDAVTVYISRPNEARILLLAQLVGGVLLGVLADRSVPDARARKKLRKQRKARAKVKSRSDAEKASISVKSVAPSTGSVTSKALEPSPEEIDDSAIANFSKSAAQEGRSTSPTTGARSPSNTKGPSTRAGSGRRSRGRRRR